MDHVTYDTATKTWCLATSSMTYVVQLESGELKDDLRHVYWGSRLSAADAASLAPRAVLPVTDFEVVGDEFPGEGGHRYGVPALQVAFTDGTRAVELRYAGHHVDGDHLWIVMTDVYYPIDLEVHYRVLPDVNVLERWAVLRHTGSADSDPVIVERLDSASWTLPLRADYRLSHVAGEHSSELLVQRYPAPLGELGITSRRGTTRHQSNPWMTVDAGDATEESGDVWSMALAWSGSWRFTTRRTYAGDLTVNVGAGHEASVRRLTPGEEFQTPVCAATHTAAGFGEASRQWHQYVRRYVLAHPDEIRPTLYNSWETVFFDVNESKLRSIADVAADLGVELFVVDDGWFGKRNSARSGLGDWWPNPEKFPNGLGPLIEHVHGLGMKLGIWVEPEMVNPDSDLYRQHPGWVLHMANRQRTERRSQLVLNFGRREVVDWAYEWLDRLLAENPIDFLKWDMNRSFSEAGWPDDDDPQRLWFGHTEGVYAVLDRLRAKYPHVRVETVSGGGGRIDLGIFRRTDQAWTSDNTDPVDRIVIQNGYTQVYPAITMGAQASDVPTYENGRVTPLRFRFHVAMAGVLGISGDLRAWSDEQRREAAELVAQYKQIRHVVQRGALYRLPAPGAGITAVQYVTDSKDESVVFVWRPHVEIGRKPRLVRLAGLDPDGRYDNGRGGVCKGDVLMNYGFDPELPRRGDYASAIVHLRRVT